MAPLTLRASLGTFGPSIDAPKYFLGQSSPTNIFLARGLPGPTGATKRSPDSLATIRGLLLRGGE